MVPRAVHQEIVLIRLINTKILIMEPNCNQNTKVKKLPKKMRGKPFSYLNKNTKISNFLDAAFHDIPNLKFGLP